jgi:hypothetical protein
MPLIAELANADLAVAKLFFDFFAAKTPGMSTAH